MWKADIFTLFPEMFPGPLGHSIAGKALAEGIWALNTVNIRDFAEDKHETVDEKPFGGGVGMVMRPDVLGKAIEATKPGKLLYMSPRGEVFNQRKAEELSSIPHISILCGRYEGIDQRVIEEYDIEEVSMGDFVLSGGEIAALGVIDACVRQLSGVLRHPAALSQESFGMGGEYSGLLEYPHYTRPAEWKGRLVPEVLLSGNHGEVDKWRKAQAEKITEERRQDLWKQYLRTKRG